MLSDSEQTAYVSRARELNYILDCVNDANCCAIVGLSNMGKSILLRSVRPAVQAGLGGQRAADSVFIYIDFNLMVDMTDQAFYELILRSARNVLAHMSAPGPLLERLQAAYAKVVESQNVFLIPLGFNEGIMALLEELGRRVVFLLDEFDGPFKRIDPRVFLNLRALKDRYSEQLCYVVATGQRLMTMRQEGEIGEFGELFAHETLYLGPLCFDDVQHAVSAFMAQEQVPYNERDAALVWEQTGGHPGLLIAVCHVLASVGGIESDQGAQFVRDKLDSDLSVRNECVKLWNGLNGEQHETLLQFVAGEGVDRARLNALQQLGLLRVDGGFEIMGALFAGFVRRQRLTQSPYVPGVRVDVESGEVHVDGELIPTLSELEYRALLLFYGRMGQLCDKYQIVEAVWGEDYIDEVDDARVEKLISRLRKKVEPEPDDPHYLKTVRGRGYMLVGG